MTTYRLLYLPAFRPVVVISLTKTSAFWGLRSRWVVQTVRFADPRPTPAAPGAQDPLRVMGRDEISVSGDAIDGFYQALVRAEFWSSPYLLENAAVSDGKVVLIEGREDGVYRVSTRINADDEPFYELARVMIRLAKLGVPLELEGKTGR